MVTRIGNHFCADLPCLLSILDILGHQNCGFSSGSAGSTKTRRWKTLSFMSRYCNTQHQRGKPLPQARSSSSGRVSQTKHPGRKVMNRPYSTKKRRRTPHANIFGRLRRTPRRPVTLKTTAPREAAIRACTDCINNRPSCCSEIEVTLHTKCKENKCFTRNLISCHLDSGPKSLSSPVEKPT